ncbi:MAG: iron chelate uptake ABC transporter family permease subunit [Desulfobacterales bacterium]
MTFMLPALLAGTAALVPEARAVGLADQGVGLPSWPELFRVLTLQDYNTRVVIIGATLLGVAAGLIGTFLLLRKRALLSDTLSHATLPGIALAFMLMSVTLGDGKNLLGLIAGAALFSVLGTASVLFIQTYTRLKDDAALGIVLSVYFGLGIALMGMATRMESGNAAGLSSFIYGKTASMLWFDAMLIAVTALGAALFCFIFFKEFSLICFDADFGAAQGWPVGRLDFLMMSLVVVVTVIGLQAVGIILVVALLIIPAAAARFWTFDLKHMLWLSGLFGGLSGLLGSALSALMANLPSGAVIVLSASAIFIISLIFGSVRGLLRLGLQRRYLQGRIRRENLLRDIYEWHESQSAPSLSGNDPTAAELSSRRAWSGPHFKRTLAHLIREGRLQRDTQGRLQLTARGKSLAREVVRKHRLWEAYLLTHADVAASVVDLSADRIEHILDQDIIGQLEKLFPEISGDRPPKSPHALKPVKGTA